MDYYDSYELSYLVDCYTVGSRLMVEQNIKYERNSTNILDWS